jgi:hypothetical protein
MLKNISDPKLRETYGAILSGKYAYKVYCMNPQKNPETKRQFHAKKFPIGFISRGGRVIDAQATDKKTGAPMAGIETSRDRLDGRKGFRCVCGNWSIQSPEEQGILDQSFSPTAPTQDQMIAIFEKVEKSGKGPLQFINGWAEYDGFALEEIKV